jgi:hypothetical protein
MITKELEEKLKLEYSAKLVNEIKYNNEEYIRAVKFVETRINYIYFKIDNNDLKEVTDIEILEYFNNLYKSENKDIIY